MDACRLSVVPQRSPTTTQPPLLSSSIPSPSDVCIQTVNQLNASLYALLDVYRLAGYAEEDASVYLSDLAVKLHAECAAALMTEQKVLEVGRQQVRILEEEVERLLICVGRATLPLSKYVIKDNLNSKLNALQHEKKTLIEECAQRKVAFTNKRRQIAILATSLGEIGEIGVIGVNDEDNVTDEAMLILESQLATLESTRSKRGDKLQVLCDECCKVFEELGVLEEGFHTLTDHQVFASVDPKIVLVSRERNPTLFTEHAKELEFLDARLKSLHEEKNRRICELASIGETIAKLWNILKIGKVDRALFQESIAAKLSMQTLLKGREELHRLQSLRAQGSLQLMTVLRQRIVDLWDECLCSDEERKEGFPLLFIPLEELDDDAIDAHETYLRSLKRRVETIRPLLLRIHAREAVVSERLELEHIQLNPDRLKDRGASAFADRKKEEAMTRSIRGLERATKEVLQSIAEYETEYGVFLYEGERYEIRVLQQENVYAEIRETLRLLRTKKRDITNTTADSTPSKPFTNDGKEKENPPSDDFPSKQVSKKTKVTPFKSTVFK